MMDPKAADKELQSFIRPQTFPVAVRMLRPGEEIPAKAKRPARDFKKLSMNCQVIDMSRRYGWLIALTREDHICALGITALGFDKPTHLYTSGTLCEGMYTETKEAGQRSEAAVDKFEPGEYYCLLVCPLDRCDFEPHLVVIYASPAQVMAGSGCALEARRQAHLLLPGTRGLLRDHRDHHENPRAPGDPPVLGRPDLRPNPGP